MRTSGQVTVLTRAISAVQVTRAGRRLSTGRRALRQLVERCHPVRRTLGWAAPVEHGVTVLSVYRRRNAEALQQVLSDLPAGWSLRLWGLDGVHPALASHTVGAGPGGRLTIFNRLLDEGRPAERSSALVLLDDDCRFVVGGLPSLLGTGLALHFDVFQPAHSALSHCSYEAVRRRRGLVARRTGFVEQGPVVVLSAAGQRALLPFSTDTAMGWGEDVRWVVQARDEQLQMGIVDSVCLRHSEPPASAYDRGPEETQLQSALLAAGAASLTDLQTDLARIRPADLRRQLRDA